VDAVDLELKFCPWDSSKVFLDWEFLTLRAFCAIGAGQLSDADIISLLIDKISYQLLLDVGRDFAFCRDKRIQRVLCIYPPRI